MIFNVLLVPLAAALTAVAAPNLEARAAPIITYPRYGTVWQRFHAHNVTWVAQTGTGEITIGHQGSSQVIKSNVDLNAGRTIITVPGNLPNGADYVVTINSNGETSYSQNFGIVTGPGAVSSIQASFTSSVVASATSSLSSAASSASASASSVGSSLSSAASSASSSLSSQASSLSASVSSVESSLSSVLSASGSSVASSVSSVLSSLSSAASSHQASATSIASSLASSAASAASSAANTSNAAGRAADLGVTRFGIAVAAGLVGFVTLGGAFVF